MPGPGTLTTRRCRGSRLVTSSCCVADITAGMLKSTRRRPTPTAPATPASRSRCRTTAAPPTAASTSTRRPNTITVNVTAVNDAPAGTEQHGHDRSRTAATPSPRPTSASPIPTTSRPTRLLAVKITTLPAAGTLTLNGVAVTAGPVRLRRRHHCRQPGLHAGGQRQRRGLRQLHLPGAGRRRHRQRRRRPRPVGQHDHGQRHLGQRRAGRHRTRRSRRLRTRRYTFTAADFGFTDPNDTPANSLAGGEDHDAAGGRHADAQRRRGRRRCSSSRVADITAGKLIFTPAANANGAGYATLHLPGAGQRRHRQRRRRPRPDAPTRSRSTSPRSTMRPAGTDKTVTINEDTAVHLRRGRLRLQRSQRHARRTRFAAVKITRCRRPAR